MVYLNCPWIADLHFGLNQLEIAAMVSDPFKTQTRCGKACPQPQHSGEADRRLGLRGQQGLQNKTVPQK